MLLSQQQKKIKNLLTIGSKSGLDKLTVRFLINNKTCTSHQLYHKHNNSYKISKHKVWASFSLFLSECGRGGNTIYYHVHFVPMHDSHKTENSCTWPQHVLSTVLLEEKNTCIHKNSEKSKAPCCRL